MIEAVYREKGAVRIIDLGGTERYWSILSTEILDRFNVHVVLVNLAPQQTLTNDERFTAVVGDACDLQEFEDGSFDIAHSNSVLEHVGGWNEMMEFSNEVKRVSRKHFVQTPYFWFPIEPHCMTPFLHWLPRPWQVSLVQRFSLGYWPRQENLTHAMRQVDSSQLLDMKMFRELFGGSKISFETVFFLPKSMIAVKD
jgi:ubiquinone/menaquinone biosynthesis C-methylase UbiE